MNIRLNSYERILDCYAFENVPDSLAEKFVAQSFDVDYFSDADLIFTEEDEIKLEKSREQWLREQMERVYSENSYQIAMAEQETCMKHWMNSHLNAVDGEVYCYLLMAEWDMSPKTRVRDYYGLWKSFNRNEELDFLYNRQEDKIITEGQEAFWGMAECKVDDISKALTFSMNKNAIILISRNPKEQLEDFANIFCVRKGVRNGYIEADYRKVFEWADKADGMYIKYSSDGEGELVGIYRKKER